ncbi:MAG: HlyD family efflux transporter periplasmic adaptor subunit [Firmicutes bacterium]|nr:HlyD family efflux transporter periplasmic adaptor subunit [Bacillota bacterium]
MKKKGMILIILLLTVVAGIALFRAGRNQKPPKESQAVDERPVVAERPCIEAFGLIKANAVMNINIDFPARVRRFYVKEGEPVTIGQALLSLDVEEYHTEIRKTEFELLNACYELKKTESQLTRLTAEIAEKEAQLTQESGYELSQIRSDLAKARQDLEMKKKLLKIQAIPASEVAALEKTVADLNRSYEHLRREKEEEIKKLKAELALIQKPVMQSSGQEVTGLSIQKEKITLLEEKLAMLRKKLDQTFIRNDAVISNIKNGVVYEIGYAEGDLLTVERKVLSIIDLDSLVVKANIAEEFIKDLRPGAEAVITPVADYTRTYHRKVVRRSEVAIKDNGETVIPVEISIEDRDAFLLPNFNVDVKIYTE